MKKQIKKPKQTKLLDIHKKLGKPKQLNNPKVLKQMVKGFSVKYALSLEETILEQHKDKIELQNTVRFLQEQVNDDGNKFTFWKNTVASQKKIIDENKEGVATLINKYEDIREDLEKQIEELQKANTQLTLSLEELKERHFGKFERRLKAFAPRPDKKKDN